MVNKTLTTKSALHLAVLFCLSRIIVVKLMWYYYQKTGLKFLNTAGVLMGKKIWILISLVLSITFIWWISKPNNETTVVYHLPEGFKGCINIISTNLIRKS